MLIEFIEIDLSPKTKRAESLKWA